MGIMLICLALLFSSFVQLANAKTFDFKLSNNYLYFFDQQSTIKSKTVKNAVNKLWIFPLNQDVVGISFEFLLESDEDLQAFDQPAFYVVLEKPNEVELIYAYNAAQSNIWQKVRLNLSTFDTKNAQLVFWVGNLGDEQKKTRLYLRSIEELVETLTSEHQEVKDFVAIREQDGSLTLEITAQSAAELRNATWWGSCGAAEPRQLIATNYYLLSQFKIVDFWPNLGQKMLFNFTDFPCADLSSLKIERRS